MSKRIILSLVAALTLALCAAPAFAWVPTYASSAGVLGKGNIELYFDAKTVTTSNAVTGYPSEGYTRLNSTFIYGLNDSMNVWVKLPYVIDNGGDPSESGIGDIYLGAKWKFATTGDWAFGLYPYVLFSTGDETKLGDAAGETNYGATLLASWGKGAWSVNINYDYYTWNTAAADATGDAIVLEGEYAFNDTWIGVGELTIETYDKGDAQQYLLAGVVFKASPKLAIGPGVKFAINDTAKDFGAETTAVLGLTYDF